MLFGANKGSLSRYSDYWVINHLCEKNSLIVYTPSQVI